MQYHADRRRHELSRRHRHLGPNGGLIKDIHASGSIVAGYKIHGSNHTTADVRSFSNPSIFWITGNSDS